MSIIMLRSAALVAIIFQLIGTTAGERPDEDGPSMGSSSMQRKQWAKRQAGVALQAGLEAGDVGAFIETNADEEVLQEPPDSASGEETEAGAATPNEEAKSDQEKADVKEGEGEAGAAGTAEAAADAEASTEDRSTAGGDSAGPTGGAAEGEAEAAARGASGKWGDENFQALSQLFQEGDADGTIHGHLKKARDAAEGAHKAAEAWKKTSGDIATEIKHVSEAISGTRGEMVKEHKEVEVKVKEPPQKAIVEKFETPKMPSESIVEGRKA